MGKLPAVPGTVWALSHDEQMLKDTGRFHSVAMPILQGRHHMFVDTVYGVSGNEAENERT